MKTNRLFPLAAAVSAFCLLPSAFGQGTLTPPGAPAATMKTLAQVEPRLPISSAPFTITAPGSYYLTTNLVTTVSNAIVIVAGGVTLDLAGFTIASTVADANNGGNAILLSSGLSDIIIRNGHIRGGVTNNGSGVYAGPGFNNGIYNPVGAVNILVSGVTVSGCLNYGIDLRSGNTSVAENCVVQTIGGVGVVASTVRGLVVRDCGGAGISGDQVSDSRGEATTSGFGIYAGQVAQNCYGVSASGSGLEALQALNCNGTTTSGYSGLIATTAQNCEGTAYGSGNGITASAAENCYASSGSGYGLYASGGNVMNCYGYSGSGIGLIAQTVAFSIGSRPGGTAISAYVANGSSAYYGTNNITYKYNMP